VNFFSSETNQQRSKRELPKNPKLVWGFDAEYLVDTLPAYKKKKNVLWDSWFKNDTTITEAFRAFIMENKNSDRKFLSKTLQRVIRSKFPESPLLSSQMRAVYIAGELETIMNRFSLTRNDLLMVLVATVTGRENWFILQNGTFFRQRKAFTNEYFMFQYKRMFFRYRGNI